MACYHPLTAYKSRTVNPSGKRSIVFDKTKSFVDLDPIQIPCGQCIGCRLERSRQWAIRCVHEASLYQQNCFLTLTYDNEHLPHVINKETGELIPSLNKRDIQLFLKRLRKSYPSIKIRFFQCGEYGELLHRPHHHVLLFNFDFPDKKFFKAVNRQPLFVSESLQRLWPYGLSSIGSLTFESAAYVARYITKKITGDAAPDYYAGRLPEFITMSRRGGIGREWFDQFANDVFPHDYIVFNNRKMKPPKYYEKLYEMQDFEKLCCIKSIRKIKAKMSTDNTHERLLVREKVQIARFQKLPRILEKM